MLCMFLDATRQADLSGHGSGKPDASRFAGVDCLLAQRLSGITLMESAHG